jgi:hypothetical protein
MNRLHTRKATQVLLLTLLALSQAWAQKVKVGYDKSADFSQFKTYAWQERRTPATRPLVAAAIQLDIDAALSDKGLRKIDASSGPDLLIVCTGGMDAQSSASAQDPGYTATGGFPLPNATMWSGSLPANAGQQVLKGALTVDVVDIRRQQLVWRGTAKANLDSQDQSKVFDQADKVVTEMFKQYPPPKTKQ